MDEKVDIEIVLRVEVFSLFVSSFEERCNLVIPSKCH